MTTPAGDALPEPAEEPSQFVVDGLVSRGLRAHLQAVAPGAGLAPWRAEDLLMAVAAVAGAMGRPGSRPEVRVWREDGSVVAEVGDLVAAGDPLAGREWPPPAAGAARGLWLANQLCDLVQVRPSGAGSLVRLHVGR